MLAFHSLSLNYWEWSKNLEGRRGWLVSATGVLCLITAGVSSFGCYQHSMIWCWIYGVTGFTLLVWSLHATGSALLIFVLYPRTASAAL